jgi:Family of unknown function (DUF6256)
MAPAGVLALTTADRQALIPMAAGYLILMTALGIGLRLLYRPRRAGPVPGPRPNRAPLTPPVPGQRTGWAALLRKVTGDVIAGYLLLLAVIVAYFFGVTSVGPGFLQGELTGTALLLGLAAPVFAALSWLAYRRGRS